MIDQLKACDQLCLVLYDDMVTVEFPLTPMTWENNEMTKAKVEKITHRGATNLCGGLLKGMEQIILRSGNQKAKVASVLLFTDGLANRGIADHDRIIAAMGTVGSLRMEELLTDTSLLEYFPPRRQSIEKVPPTFKLQQQIPPVPHKWSSECRKRHQLQDKAPQQSTISPPKSDDTRRHTGGLMGPYTLLGLAQIPMVSFSLLYPMLPMGCITLSTPRRRLPNVLLTVWVGYSVL